MDHFARLRPPDERPRRRTFLRAAARAAALLTAGAGLPSAARSAPAASAAGNERRAPGDTYETHATDVRILPGAWRPHYPYEHIAWVSPSWPCQDYLWLDFPEAIFTSQGLLFLSHVNPPIATVYHDLPPVPWRQVDDGIAFDRTLPGGVRFGGSVRQGKRSTVALELTLENGSGEALRAIKLQTCAFLRAVREFSAYTRDNKFVHTADDGWVTVEDALARQPGTGRFGVGWRSSRHRVADLPVLVTVSSEAERLVAMTWFDDTISMISNARHPCMHADPGFPDLAPGEKATIRGSLIFFEGKLADFDFRDYAPS